MSKICQRFYEDCRKPFDYLLTYGNVGNTEAAGEAASSFERLHL